MLPADRREREPLALEGADVGIGRVEGLAALVGGDAGDGDARADGRAAGEQGHGLGRPAVVAQRGQAQAGEAGQDDVAVDPVDQPARAAGADQVVAARDVASPPMSLAPEGLVLPATMVSVRCRPCRELYRPPPAVAELPLTVQSVRLAVPK